jgi:geranylgeranyl diphosphate synthase type I
MSDAALLDEFSRRFLPHLEAEMRAVVNEGQQPRLFNVMLNYHLGFTDSDGAPATAAAGKRIRPMLTLLSCEACGGDWQQALPAAAAIELLHNFSLIHDDIEDRDELRRGRPTLWKLWGEAQAINAGDAMFALAHLALLRAPAEPARLLRAMRVFEQMCVQLTIGQHLDLSFEARNDVTAEEYLRMIEGKTAALTAAACEIGALLGGGDEATVRALAGFGRWLGIAFQLQDDVLGIWGDPALTGKQDSDLANGKKTLPVLYAAERDPRVRTHYTNGGRPDGAEVAQIRALIEAAGGKDHAERAAREAYASALAALDAAGLNNPAGQALRALAERLVERRG